jgi:GNAT superfamily N-acetyltransferase
MTIYVTKITRKATGERVDAEMHDALDVESLFDAEELWAPERVKFLRECAGAGVSTNDLPQSIHWDWSLKPFRNPELVSGINTRYRLFGINAEGQWQGLLLAERQNRGSRIKPGACIIYVEYVESAPWNWDHKPVKREARFKGVGTQLLEMAVQWSEDAGCKGRLGLHALPQAVHFYQEVCKMTALGADDGLAYFELSEDQAIQFLR